MYWVSKINIYYEMPYAPFGNDFVASKYNGDFVPSRYNGITNGGRYCSPYTTPYGMSRNYSANSPYSPFTTPQSK